MRLAQLARKLEVRSTELVEVLAKADLPIDDNSNSKISDQQLEVLLKHYGVTPDLETVTNEGEESNAAAAAPPSETNLDVVPDIEPTSVPEQATSIEPQPEPEVIKPVKVSLPGLKVVGKIDLPEPKKKPDAEALKSESETTTADGGNPERGGKNRRNAPRNPQTSKPRKNPIALEREREEREALRKKLEQQKKDKEVRTNNYFKKLQDAKPQKKVSKKRKSVEQFETLDSHVVQLEPPKTLIGKIWRWLKPPTQY